MLDSAHPRKPDFPSKSPPSSKTRFWLILAMLLLLLVGIFVGSRLVIFAQKILDRTGQAWSFRELFIAGDKKLQGEEEGIVHFLLLGIGGEQHEGSTLTDTMILATLNLNNRNKPQIGLVSIPRDLLVYIPGYEYRKINTAYAFGELDGQNQGPELALKALERPLEKSIPYYAVIDFTGVKKIIDDLGGLKIYVDQEFTDALFPDDRGGYLEPITFRSGWQIMDGERVLQFVRSRHGSGNEGTDFARSKRQQKVLLALKEELASFRVLSNFSLAARLLEELSDHARTNLELHELKHLYELVREVKKENIFSLAIDVESGLVCNQIQEETGAYVLIPCQGLENYAAIREVVNSQFLISSLEKEQAVIEIQNASGLPLLGSRAANFLTLPYLKLTATNFQGQADYEQSIIYDNTAGEKNQTLEYLSRRLGIKVAGSRFPFPTLLDQPDFVIVITSDLAEKLP